MAMGRHFGLQKSHGLLATGFAKVARAQTGALAGLHGRAALKIGQSKVAFAISAIGGPQKREQSCVLAEWHELAVAQGPTFGSKISCKDSDFGKKWI